MHPILTHLTTASPWLLVALLLTGVLLWLAGHKLLRGGTLVAGLLVGAALVAAAMPGDISAGWLLAWVGIGAAVGAVVAWVLFRITTGAAMAMALAVVVCVGYSTWQNLPQPTLFETQANESDDRLTNEHGEQLSYTGRFNDGSASGSTSLAITAEDTPAEAQLALAPLGRFDGSENDPRHQPAAPPAAAFDNMKFDWQLPVQTIEQTGRETMDAFVTQAQAKDSLVHAATSHLANWGLNSRSLAWQATAGVGRWWIDLPLVHQVALVLVAGLAAVLGMMLGIAMPYTAAAAETSLIGAAVGIPAAIGLCYFFSQQMPGLMPQTPHGWVFTLTIATVIGTLAQYWLWQRQKPEPEEA